MGATRTAFTGRRAAFRDAVKELLGRIGVGTAYLAGRLRRRDPRTWVFGNIKGFRDNPRYLAEYVADQQPELKPWWLARTETEAAAARASGLRAAIIGTDDGRDVQRRAGAAFLSNGFQDLEAVHLGGTYVVDLRHGKGLKRILLDQGDWAGGARAGTPIARRIRRWFAARRLAQVDMIVAGGEWAKAMYVSAFRCPPSKVRALGSPRFDVILGGPAYERVAGGDLRERLGVTPDEHLVLWLPTWREEGGDDWLPALSADEVEAAWAGTRVVMLVKRHPYSDDAVYASRLPRSPRVRLLPEDDADVNALLRVTDALVTDFSSAAFDYALLDRPIHFFVPDLDRYRGGRGLYEPLEAISGGRHHVEWATLLEEVAAVARGDDPESRSAARRIRGRSRNNDAPGSCRRITAAVAEALGIAHAVRSEPGATE